MNLAQSNFSEHFWQQADITKDKEKYRIDKNLRYLKLAPLSMLKKIFIQYRFFTHFYIQDLSLLIGKLPLGELRSILAEILSEELGEGNYLKSHPALYDNFLKSIDITSAEFEVADPYCLNNLKSIQAQLIGQSWGYGVGLRGMGGECLCQIYLSTMHEYFSQNMEILAIYDQIDWTFWNIHIGELDLHHQQLIRTAINNLIAMDPSRSVELIKGYQESKGAWDSFWQHIFTLAKVN